MGQVTHTRNLVQAPLFGGTLCPGGGFILTEACSDYSSCPIDCVATWGQTEVVKLLLAAGADKTRKNMFGKTALDYAETDEIKALLR